MESISELELRNLGIRRSKPGRWGWYLAGLVVLGSAGFVLSYYLPLMNAHSALVTKHDQLGSKAAELDHALKTTKEKLDSTEKQRVALQATETERASALKASSDKLKTAQATIENTLARSIKSKRLTIDSDATELVLKFSKAFVYLPASAKVSATGRRLLCSATKVLSSDMRLRTAVSVPVASGASADDWSMANKQAGAAAAVLLEGCGKTRSPVRAEVRSSSKASETVDLVVTAEQEAP
jgi:hypothetical protein